MSQEEHRAAQEETLVYVEARGIRDHIFYGPMSDSYWNEPLRMVAINLEPWGYGGCGIFRAVDHELRKWIEDSSSGQRSKTVRGTFALMAVALSHLDGSNEASPASFQAAFRDRVLLDRTLLRTTYYNMRPESNPSKNQDIRAITSVGSSDLGRLVWREIKALDPHVVFVSGKAGLAALNALLGLDKPIGFRQCFVHPDGFMIQSIAHPSRANYSQWTAAVEAIGENMRGTSSGSADVTSSSPAIVL